MHPAPTLQDAERALLRRFGHPAFREHQAAAVEAVLAGRDLLMSVPTGGGKSLVYQLPALCLEGLTLVLSPLIALMKDQVDALCARGIAASCVNSAIPPAERAARLAAAAEGRLDLLYVTPERFRSPRFRELIPRLNITRLAVDEAHCISQWGHDFRPDYARLSEYRALLGDPPTAAFTATATPRVAADIVTNLRLCDPLIVRAGVERPELFLAATPVELPEDKVPLLAERVAAMDGAGIVYSTLIRDLEALREELLRRGIASLVYHGKLSPEERRSMQERFMNSERAVVLATNAFGMGVDKEDIRFVIHAQVPRTLEAWVQELGRAGRDGKRSWCELLYHPEDVALQQEFVRWANPSREYLLQIEQTLRAWGERSATKDEADLRDELLTKSRGDNRLGLCLRWLEVLGVTAGSFEGGDLRVVRELDPAELPEALGSPEKLEADLLALLAVARLGIGRERCRRAVIAEHFELPAPAPLVDGGCGACDVCTDAQAWRSAHIRTRPAGAAGREPEGPRDAPFQRGDWVRVRGRHLGRVVRVEGRGSRLRVEVEDAADLRRRVLNPRRVQIERVEG